MTPYTLRVVLRTNKKNKEGLAPLYIVFTLQRSRTYIKTPYRVHEDNWNGKEVTGLHNAASINAALRKQMADLDKEIHERRMDGRSVTLQSIKRQPATNFFTFVKDAKGDKPADIRECNRIRSYAGENLRVSDIDVVWLRRYEKHQRTVPATYNGIDKHGLAQNTINTTFKWLRRVMNLAKREGMIKESPFADYEVPKYEQSERVFLSGQERQQWFTYWQQKKIGGSHYITLTYFLIGVFSGLRHSDWQKVNDRVFDGFIRLRAKKNKEWVVLPIGTSLAELLKVAKTLPPPFSGDKSREHLKVIAGRLDCDKNVTTHSARHSFAAMCAELQIPKSVTAELMGVNVQTVDVYYHLTGQNIIEQAAALRDV